ncbi:putative glycolipid-binding domain-containing protein [Roseomonas mucosa]|uniref:putative glycolipid-binding domain-containing protein n=1 Tax=Roseomonas mucosa TaxID=207340 RepID=UPI0028CC4376|nr:putative glycolipid-binding domain-containing protein [Roseomonas sp. DSM 102946]
METSVRWCDWQGDGLEHCTYRCDDRGLVLEGVTAGTREGWYGVHYLVRTDAAFRTREVRVAYVASLSLHVEADGQGQWRDLISKRSLPLLDGCLDVDIGVTPATNTLPIKRLGLREQESKDIRVAYVPLPSEVESDFLPRPADQRYTCLTPGQRYRYEGLFRSFVAELEVDEFSLVRDYPDTFRRI